MDDQTLLRKAVEEGDSAAFHTLMDRHYMTIYKMAFKWCGHQQDAEDVTQEVCMKVAKSIQNFKGDAAFTSWLYQIVLNTARDLFRSRQSQREREAGYMDAAALEDDARPDIEETAIRNEALAAITALPEDLKAAVLLVAGEGLSHKEAGAILNCAEGTISWRISEAKKQLSQRYGKKGGDHDGT